MRIYNTVTIVAGIGLSLVVSADSALAQLVTYRVSGNVFELSDPDGDFPPWRPGTPVNGFLSYDPSTPDEFQGTQPLVAQYSHLKPFVGIEFTVDDFRFRAVTAPHLSIVVSNDDSTYVDGFTSDVIVFSQPAQIPSDAFSGTAAEFALLLWDRTGTQLPDVSLPAQLGISGWLVQIGLIAVASDAVSDVVLSALIRDLTPCDAGDANCDGRVDEIDFGIISDNFGAFQGFAQGDFNRDGQTSFADFLMMAHAFEPKSAEQILVPEPVSSGLSIVGVLAMAVGEYRRFFRGRSI